MNVSLTPELESFIANEVKAGLYRSASDVIVAGLRRLKEDKERRPRFMVASTDELEEKLLEGVRQLDRGEGIPGEVAFARLRERARARAVKHG